VTIFYLDGKTRTGLVEATLSGVILFKGSEKADVEKTEFTSQIGEHSVARGLCLSNQYGLVVIRSCGSSCFAHCYLWTSFRSVKTALMREEFEERVIMMTRKCVSHSMK